VRSCRPPEETTSPGDPAGSPRAQVRRASVPGHMVQAAVEQYPGIPVADDQTWREPLVCRRSIRSGFTSVMNVARLADGGTEDPAPTDTMWKSPRKW